ncbi:MAG: hypothetical protein ACP5KG_07240 [Myxococcota bacterium]
MLRSQKDAGAMYWNNKRFRYLFTIVIVLPLFSCTKKQEEDICHKMQMMAERCEPEILAIIKGDMNNDERAGWVAPDYQMIESRIKKKISQKQGEKQCAKFRDSKEPEQKRRYQVIKDCTQSKNCKDFADCIITF